MASSTDYVVLATATENEEYASGMYALSSGLCGTAFAECVKDPRRCGTDIHLWHWMVIQWPLRLPHLHPGSDCPDWRR